MIYEDRAEAGRRLASRVQSEGLINPRVIALPRGGVPVGLEIAKSLNVPFDVLIVRKIGAPQNPEFGIGAITEEKYFWIDSRSQAALGLSDKVIRSLAINEQSEVNRRIQYFRKGRSLPSVQGQSILLVDDGLATGVTAKVASHYLKLKGAKEVILAVPVAPQESLKELKEDFDKIICLETPDPFYSVGVWYQDFRQLDDEEVRSMLFDA